MRFGAPHRHYRRTDSTNYRARELGDDGAPGGTVVTAEEQTAGRGRQGRTWTAPAGKALLYSGVLRPLGDRPLLPLAVALAVCETAEELAPGLACQIKWPNDVWVDERKLAGILIETKVQDDWAVIGVGLNLSIASNEFPPDLRDTAVSLFGSTAGGRGDPRRSLPAVAPAGVSPTPLTAAIALSRHLSRWIEAEPQTVLATYRERDALSGREISWSAGPDLSEVAGSGVAAGIDDRGGLVVRLPGGGSTVLFAGEVHLRL
ncbi:MAG TPA: biotin--[acetyl-CoA-carboxylase] ligase [Solirubrobacterales bacterium]|nr:biotin--[acetyl-CoA-carboxylase] ligase [Solirubrobacterales bacterium]